MTIHKNYHELTNDERDFVDAAFDEIFRNAKAEGIRLNGSDPAERAVEAMATFILESRKAVPPRVMPGTIYTDEEAEGHQDGLDAQRDQALEDERNAFDSWAGKVRP